MQRQNVSARCAKSRQTPVPLLVDVMRGLHVMGVLVAEGDVVVDEVGDRGYPRPARLGVAEQRPRDVGQLVGLAIAARHQIQQHFVRQLVDRNLLRGRHHHVGQSGIAHQRAAAQGDAAGRRHQPAADIAETVAVKADRQRHGSAVMLSVPTMSE